MKHIIRSVLIIIGACSSALLWAGQTLNNVTISNSAIVTGDSNKVVINQTSRSSGGGTSINASGNSSVVNVNGVSVTVNKDTAEIIIPSNIKSVRVKINNQWKKVLP